MSNGPLRSMLSMAAGFAVGGPLGAAAAMGLDSALQANDALNDAKAMKKPLGAMEMIAPPPTESDAKKNLNGEGGVKTYGRAGTFATSGGRSGLASSTLNLTSQSLMGS